MLTAEQISELKRQLSAQIQHLPPEQKAQAQQQIDSMSTEALESMLDEQKARAGIFRKIAAKEVQARIIDENADAIAVLEIRPASKGHVIVIPKIKVESKEKIPEGMKSLTSSLADRIKSAMQAKSVRIISEKKFGEIITDIMPVYDNEPDMDSEREVASPEELDEVQKKIMGFHIIKKPEKEVIKKEEKNQEIIKLRRKRP